MVSDICSISILTLLESIDPTELHLFRWVLLKPTRCCSYETVFFSPTPDPTVYVKKRLCIPRGCFLLHVDNDSTNLGWADATGPGSEAGLAGEHPASSGVRGARRGVDLEEPNPSGVGSARTGCRDTQQKVEQTCSSFCGDWVSPLII